MIIETIVVITVSVIGASTWLWWHTTRSTKSEPTPTPQQEKFGLKHPPVPAIRARLPKVPYPLEWESWVDRSGPYAVLVIRLVNLSNDGEVLAERRVSIEANTEFLASTYPTWAAYMRSYPSIGWNQFCTYVIEPVADWARRSVAENRPDGDAVTDYRMGRSA